MVKRTGPEMSLIRGSKLAVAITVVGLTAACAAQSDFDAMESRLRGDIDDLRQGVSRNQSSAAEATAAAQAAQRQAASAAEEAQRASQAAEAAAQRADKAAVAARAAAEQSDRIYREELRK